MSYSSAHTVATVAKREIAVATKNKGLIVTMAITLALILAGIGAFAYFGNDAAPSAPRIAATDPAVLAGTGAEISTVADRAAAEAAVVDGSADAALVRTESGWELLADGFASPSISALVSESVSTFETHHALDAVGVSPEVFGAALGPTDVTPVDISSGADQSQGDLVTVLIALAGVMVLIFSIILFAANIGSRVTEEKSSRVVELILATVRPLDFLAGKILGNVLIGLVCTSVLVTAGGLALAATGIVEDIEFDWMILPILLLSFLLGMLFFGSLYAAAGAMVQRTEDLQSTQMPVMLLIFVVMYVPMFGWSSADATWMQVMGWLPPVSVATAPIQYAAGNMNLAEVGMSMLIMAAFTVLTIWLVSRIYRASILNNGQKLTWMKALRARPA